MKILLISVNLYIPTDWLIRVPSHLIGIHTHLIKTEMKILDQTVSKILKDLDWGQGSAYT